MKLLRDFSLLFFVGQGLTGAADAAVYAAPPGGWNYGYGGSSAAVSPVAALDGSWKHNDKVWDGSPLAFLSPGGAEVQIDSGVTYLRIQDTGNPIGYGFPDPGSNREVYFGNEPGLSANVLDSGVTFYFRTRLATSGLLDMAYPEGGTIPEPWPAGGDGYVIHDGGRGNFVINQSSGGSIGFSLDDAGGGLLMNRLNGTDVTGDVDTMDTDGTTNILDLGDTSLWHDIWITIRASDVGTHEVSIYTDGSLSPTLFNVTAGDSDDFLDSYIAMGAGSTPESGAFDVDSIFVREGLFAPQLVPEPSGLALLGIGLLALLRRRR